MSRAPDDDYAPPPHNPEAEQIVLGAMMLSGAAVEDVQGTLRSADDFYRPAHQVVAESVFELHAAGEPHDAVAVADHLAARGMLSKVGGGPYLHTLIACVPTAANAGWYAGKVRARAVDRNIIEAGTRLVQLGWERGGDTEWEIADRLDQVYRIADEASGLAAPASARPLGELLIPTLDRIDTGQGSAAVPTPWEDLNALLGGGWRPGFNIVASRPQVGKSVMLLNSAVTAALAGVPVLLCTLEMKTDECNMRILSAASRIPYIALRDGQVSEDGWDRLADTASKLADVPLRIDERGYQTVRSIAGELRRMQRDGAPCGLLCVDYLQLMRHPGKWDGNKQGEVSEISRGLKLLCDDFGLAALVAAQLNRGPEMRSSHLPLLADLRDSGSVEQDADVVVLLAREEVYNRESPRAGEIDMIVAKHRQGPTATITAAFEGHVLTVTDKPWSPSAQGTE